MVESFVSHAATINEDGTREVSCACVNSFLGRHHGREGVFVYIEGRVILSWKGYYHGRDSAIFMEGRVLFLLKVENDCNGRERI